MRKHTKIECSPAVRELNESIETADLLTGYHFDKCSGEEIAGVLESEGCPFHAADLRGKLAAVESQAEHGELVFGKSWKSILEKSGLQAQ